MSDNLVFLLVGGLGFFFFGMKTMGEGLKKIAGEKLKNFLHNVTKLPIIGVCVGAFVTCLVQSSSATTVMVVGFVNAGLLSLRQAISVIMGANIGTTITAWLVSSMSVFNITAYALPSVGIGFAVMTLAKSRKTKHWGQILLGFGLLFIGLHFMKDAFNPLKESEIIKQVFMSFSNNPILGVLAGLIFTLLLQSSSATIAIIQVLAFNGVLDLNAAIPLILGDNIGTTITAQLAAIGTNVNARRAAMSHTIFNVAGALYMLAFVYLGWVNKFIDIAIPGEITTINIMFYIAISHTAIKLLNTAIFLPFIDFIEKTSIWLVPQKGDAVDSGTQYLEKHLLNTPSLAFEQVYNETVYMLNIAKKAVNNASDGLMENNFKKLDKVAELEAATDSLQSEITQYLIELSQRTLLPEESEEFPVLIHNVNDIERIGDYSQNLAELARRKIEENLIFTDKAVEEIQILWKEIQDMGDEATEALSNNNIAVAKNMLKREEHINNLHDKYKQSHITRLHEGICNLNSGFIFVEIVDNLEKIGDRLTNIAQSVIGKMKWDADKQKNAL
ncbi:MAG: Na/Pi cotransporter family protein [Candidatus Zapsychrus exili]|nr:Na/Pi cotransporter family protein [Candidatus Zapsychrus exili]